MYVDAVARSSLFEALSAIDRDLASSCQAQGCPSCGGPLHQAFYDRKPRGGPPDLPAHCSVRRSLCCGRDGCRRRTLPPSCLFLGRKVYWAAIVLVVVALRQRRPASASARQLRRLFEVSWDTVKRWLSFFALDFARCAHWQRCRGLVSGTVTNDDLPAGLLELLVEQHHDEPAGLVAALRLLAGDSAGATRQNR